MKKSLVFLCALTGVVASFAQEPDSVIWLSEVLVEESSDPYRGLGFQIMHIPAEELRSNEGVSFTELLNRQVPGAVRTYGISGLATANLRGTGSSHTAILWNGISLESPSNGVTDLSQITSGLLDHVAIQFGSSSGTFGSGAIGGTLHLNNQPTLDSGYQLTANLLTGSFGRQYQHYKAEYGSKNHTLGFSWFNERAENDFTFNNTTRRGAPEETWEHSAVERRGFLASYYLRTSPNRLKILWWHQSNQLEIPNPATVASAGSATQEDLFDRLLLSLDWQRKNGAIKLNAALITNRLSYQDEDAQQASETDFYTLQNEIKATQTIGSFDLNGSLSHRYEWITSSGFSGGETFSRHRTSAYLGVQKNFEGWFNSTLELRQERVGDQWVPVIPSLLLVKSFKKRLALNANVSRVYRVPTFNDLFWNAPGGEGNPNLQPENGWTWEAGADWELAPNQDKLNIAFSIFSSHINDWILWTPVAASIWSPNNIKAVWSRGTQVQFRYTILKNDKWSVKLRGNYQYVQSTNEKVRELGNQQELNKQLIYTPLHQGGATLLTKWKSLEVTCLVNWVGEQYTTGDNNPFLTIDPFWTTNMRITYEGKIRQIRGALRLELNNLLDQQYFIRAGYPMPGLHFNFGLNLKLSQHATNF